MDTNIKKGIKQDADRRIPYLFLILPAIISIVLVIIYGVNVPFADEWGIVDLYHKIEQNGLHFSYFFAQHNEHRILFPRIVLLTVALLTKWNVVAQMLVSQLILLFVGLCCCKYFRNKNGKTAAALWAAVPLTVLIFSLRQYENMYWGFQVGFYMVFAFSVFSFYFYDKYENIGSMKYLYFSGICAVIVSFSSIHGLLIWICYLVLFLAQRIFEKVKISKRQIFFLMVGAACWIVYFIGYHKPEGHPQLGQGGLLNLIKYFLVSVGSSMIQNSRIAGVFGILICTVLILIAGFLIWKKQIRENRFPCLLIVFGVGVLASITLGRAGFGIGQALSSRYTTYSLLIPIGIYIIGYPIIKAHFPKFSSKQWFGMVVALLLLPLSLINILEITSNSQDRKYAEYALQRFDSVPNETRKHYFPIEVEPYMTEYPQILKDKKFSVFNQGKNYQDVPGVIFEEDAIDGLLIGMGDKDIKNIDNQYLLISNVWAVDARAEEAASGVYIKINDAYYPAYYGISRPDVANYFKNRKYKNSGFEACIPMNRLKPGNNTIQAFVVGKNKSYYYTSSAYSFVYDTAMTEIEGVLPNFKSTDFAVDSINGEALKNEIQIKKDGMLNIRGWAVDREAKNALSDIRIKIGDQIFPVMRQSRPDVAVYFNIPKYENSGFTIDISAAELPQGNFQWSIIGFSFDKNSYYEIPGGQTTRTN